MADGLTDQDLHALATAFSDRERARLVLSKAGYPAAVIPFEATTPLQFWTSVSENLRHGALKNGRARLIEAAAFFLGPDLPGRIVAHDAPDWPRHAPATEARDVAVVAEADRLADAVRACLES